MRDDEPDGEGWRVAWGPAVMRACRSKREGQRSVFGGSSFNGLREGKKPWKKIWKMWLGANGMK